MVFMEGTFFWLLASGIQEIEPFHMRQSIQEQTK